MSESTGLPTVPDLPGQSRILYPVPGVPGGGYNVPDFRGLKCVKEKTKEMSLKCPKITIHTPDFTNFLGGYTPKPLQIVIINAIYQLYVW